MSNTRFNRSKLVVINDCSVGFSVGSFKKLLLIRSVSSGDDDSLGGLKNVHCQGGIFVQG